MIGVWHLSRDGNWPDVIGYAGIYNGRVVAFSANSYPACLSYSCVSFYTHARSSSAAVLANVSWLLHLVVSRVQTVPAHRGLQKVCQ